MKPTDTMIMTLKILKKKREYKVTIADRLSYFVMSTKYNEQPWISLRYNDGKRI